MQNNGRTASRFRFDMCVRTRSVKATDALGYIVHGDPSTAPLGSVRVGTRAAIIEQALCRLLIHADAVIGHLDKHGVLTVFAYRNIDMQRAFISNTR